MILSREMPRNCRIAHEARLRADVGSRENAVYKHAFYALAYGATPREVHMLARKRLPKP